MCISGACAADCTRDGGLKCKIFAPDCSGSDISDPGSDFQAERSERQQAREETKREAFDFFGALKLRQAVAVDRLASLKPTYRMI